MRAVTQYARSLLARLTDNKVGRSMIRHGWAETNRNRSLVVFSNFFLHIHPVKVRLRAIAFSQTYYLGGLSAVTAILLTVTGLFLMFYYRPAVPQAYHDMKDLEFAVSAGIFIRNLHRWAAHAMVALVFLHMIRVFFAGAYRPPREFNWVIGVLLFVVTLLLSYTGYLLPWDQLAYWAVTVGTNMADATPVIGPKIKFLMLGGNALSENALLRFYVLHCILLPAVLYMLVAIHIWRIRKDGGILLPPASEHDYEKRSGKGYRFEAGRAVPDLEVKE
jgi:quinol-cytochrome oxidoreductase complex cytochrome b subunit